MPAGAFAPHARMIGARNAGRAIDRPQDRVANSVSAQPGSKPWATVEASDRRSVNSAQAAPVPGGEPDEPRLGGRCVAGRTANRQSSRTCPPRTIANGWLVNTRTLTTHPLYAVVTNDPPSASNCGDRGPACDRTSRSSIAWVCGIAGRGVLQGRAQRIFPPLSPRRPGTPTPASPLANGECRAVRNALQAEGTIHGSRRCTAGALRVSCVGGGMRQPSNAALAQRVGVRVLGRGRHIDARRKRLGRRGARTGSYRTPPIARIPAHPR